MGSDECWINRRPDRQPNDGQDSNSKPLQAQAWGEQQSISQPASSYADTVNRPNDPTWVRDQSAQAIKNGFKYDQSNAEAAKIEAARKHAPLVYVFGSGKTAGTQQYIESTLPHVKEAAKDAVFVYVDTDKVDRNSELGQIVARENIDKIGLAQTRLMSVNADVTGKPGELTTVCSTYGIGPGITQTVSEQAQFARQMMAGQNFTNLPPKEAIPEKQPTKEAPKPPIETPKAPETRVPQASKTAPEATRSVPEVPRTVPQAPRTTPQEVPPVPPAYNNERGPVGIKLNNDPDPRAHDRSPKKPANPQVEQLPKTVIDSSKSPAGMDKPPTDGKATTPTAPKLADKPAEVKPAPVKDKAPERPSEYKGWPNPGAFDESSETGKPLLVYVKASEGRDDKDEAASQEFEKNIWPKIREKYGKDVICLELDRPFLKNTTMQQTLDIKPDEKLPVLMLSAVERNSNGDLTFKPMIRATASGVEADLYRPADFAERTLDRWVPIAQKQIKENFPANFPFNGYDYYTNNYSDVLKATATPGDNKPIALFIGKNQNPASARLELEMQKIKDVYGDSVRYVHLNSSLIYLPPELNLGKDDVPAVVIAGVKRDDKGELVFDPKAIAAGPNYDHIGQLIYKPIPDSTQAGAAGAKPSPDSPENLAGPLFKSIYAAKDSLKQNFPGAATVSSEIKLATPVGPSSISAPAALEKPADLDSKSLKSIEQTPAIERSLPPKLEMPKARPGIDSEIIDGVEVFYNPQLAKELAAKQHKAAMVIAADQSEDSEESQRFEKEVMRSIRSLNKDMIFLYMHPGTLPEEMSNAFGECPVPAIAVCGVKYKYDSATIRQLVREGKPLSPEEKKQLVFTPVPESIQSDFPTLGQVWGLLQGDSKGGKNSKQLAEFWTAKEFQYVGNYHRLDPEFQEQRRQEEIKRRQEQKNQRQR